MTTANLTSQTYALAPRYLITSPSERPTDQAFAYFVKFFRPSGIPRGTLILWTDSRKYAEQFASSNHVYARPSVVQGRDEWASGRVINLTESTDAG